MVENTINYSKKWYILSAVGISVFLATIDASIVNVALPTFVRYFNTEFSIVQWVPLSYMLIIASLILSVGRLGDLIGKKNIYISGMIVFTLGSIFCGISTSIYWLIAARIFQGIGAAMMAALGAAIITEAFPDKERGRALGSIGGFVSLGIITGPALGGLLIDALSWHWIFFINVPVAAIGLVMVTRFLPAVKPKPGQKFDIAGALILFISVFTFLFTLTWGQKLGFSNPLIIALFMVWIISFFAFLAVELNVQSPLIDLTLFRNYLFSSSLILGFLSFFTTAGIVLLMPFYLENILGYPPHQVGLLLIAIPISAGIASPISGILSDRFGTRLISSIGLLVLLTGYTGLTTLSAETTSLGYIMRFLPIGLGLGIFQSPNNSAIMGSAPPERIGIVSGLLSITRNLGQTAGIAVLGAFWATRVAINAQITSPADPTQLQKRAQISGLTDTITAISVIITIALALSIWNITMDRKRRSSGRHRAS